MRRACTDRCLQRSPSLKPRVETTVWESLALANTTAGLAANRRYAYHAIGALGVIEMTAPERAGATAAGLKRLGVPFDEPLLRSSFGPRRQALVGVECRSDLPPRRSESKRCPAIAEGALMQL
jgi:hypothetical protein